MEEFFEFDWGLFADYNREIGDPKAALDRAEFLMDQGDFKHAILDLNYYIEHFPGDIDSFILRGKCYSSLNLFNEAVDDVLTFLNKKEFNLLDTELQSFISYTFFKRGNYRFDQKDYKGAIEDYNIVIGMNPKNAELYFNRGILNCLLGDYTQEMKDYAKTIEIDPKHFGAYFNRGLSKKRNLDFNGAIDDFTLAIKLNPDVENLFFLRGTVKYLLKDYIGAIEDYSIAIEKDPKDAVVFYNRGLSKIQLGQNNSACDDFKNAGKLGYNDAFDLLRKYCGSFDKL